MNTETIKIETLTSTDMAAKAVAVGIAKSRLPAGRMLLLALLAGVYIGFGCLLSSVVTTGASASLPYGITRLLGGIIFCLGLILVVVGGAELFTGNALMVIALIDRKISLSSMLRNWGIVYFGNFIGSILLALMVFWGRAYTFGGGQVGETILKTASTKLSYSFGQAFVLGILCNILVCLAVWLTFSATSTTDKILAVLFPITAFVAAGFEHSVANMYALPMAYLIKIFDPAFIAAGSTVTSSITTGNILLANLLPVSLGNIVGGALFVGLIYGLAFLPKLTEPERILTAKVTPNILRSDRKH